MKMKSFAMLAASGLLATSLAYVAPAMADDTSASGPSMQAPTDNSMQNQNAGTPPNNVGSSSDSSTSSDSSSGMGSSPDSSNSSTGSSSSDEASPDTATGDDDY